MDKSTINLRKAPVKFNLTINVTRELKIKIYTAVILIKLAAWILGGITNVKYED